MSQHIDLVLDQEIIDAAKRRTESNSNRAISRTQASPLNYLAGQLGEMVFAQWLWGDWRRHHSGLHHGSADLAGRIEVKTSAVPLDIARRMICRQDYMEKRAVDYYVQLIIDVRERGDDIIEPGTICRLAGWTDHATFSASPLEELKDKKGNPVGYMSYCLPLASAKPMADFPRAEFPAPKKISPLQLMGARL